MKRTAAPVNDFSVVLRTHAGRYDVELTETAIEHLCDYYQLVREWNPRLHLVAPCSPAEFATRHVLESLFLLAQLPKNARVADVGSGAGLPIIPVLTARPDVRATLIESSQKKSVFLREALRLTAVSTRATVLAERFEKLPRPEVDWVTCRALDRFSGLFPKLVQWAPRPATLLLFGGEGLGKQIGSAGLKYKSLHIPDSERRLLFVIKSASVAERRP
jgi:16S rRNA (guanine527-N7)-methyltransferase